MPRHDWNRAWSRSCSGLLLFSILMAPFMAPMGSKALVPRHVSRATAASQATHATAPTKSSAHPSAKQTPAAALPHKPAALRLSRDVFGGLGAWIDLYDTNLDVGRTIRWMRFAGVRTLYIETGWSSASTDIIPTNLKWLAPAHRAGIKVVGWYLPVYKKVGLDVRRTVAIARANVNGERFDGLGVDIEVKGGKNWNRKVWKQLAAVRKHVGRGYPIAAIVPPPLQMEAAPMTWAGFPWEPLARYADAFLLMSYWSDRSGCPEIRVHCAYEYTAGNVELTRVLARHGDVLVHIIGGVGNLSNPAQIDGFIRGVRNSHADGASIYDVNTTSSWEWRRLRALGSHAK